MFNMYYIAQRFKLLYRIPPECWLMIMAGFLAFWTILMLLIHGRDPVEQGRSSVLAKRSLRGSWLAFATNLSLMLVGLTIILLVTFVRRETTERQVILIPFRVLFGMRAPGDYWHVTVMNIVLYVPFACGFCYVMGKRCSHPVCMTVLVCFSLSFASEALQYVLNSGWVEVDDVLMNTLGAFLGTLPYTLCRRIIDSTT